jgi:peptidyl-dipeptidase Dcp
MTNPLLAEWDTPFNLAPFDAISDEDFAPAFDAAIQAARAEVAAIAETPDAPTFANTIEALEASGHALDKVLSVFFTVAGADSNPRRQALQREFGPKLAAYSSELYGNKQLFARVEAVWQARATLDLTAEQQRLLMLTHRAFRRAGAALTGEDDARMRAIMARLAELGTGFTQNLLADEAGWHMELSEADLEGLPDFVIRSARAAGQEKGTDGPVITLSRSLIVPFLQFSPRRDLRRRAFEAWSARGTMGGETDNRASGLQELCRLQAGNRDGQDARGRARPADGGMGTGQNAGRGRCRNPHRDDARRRDQRRAGAVGLALLFRETATGRA